MLHYRAKFCLMPNAVPKAWMRCCATQDGIRGPREVRCPERVKQIFLAKWHMCRISTAWNMCTMGGSLGIDETTQRNNKAIAEEQGCHKVSTDEFQISAGHWAQLLTSVIGYTATCLLEQIHGASPLDERRWPGYWLCGWEDVLTGKHHFKASQSYQGNLSFFHGGSCTVI